MPRKSNNFSVALHVSDYNDKDYGPDNRHVKALYTSVLLQLTKDALLPDKHCVFTTSAGRENFQAREDAINFFFCPKEDYKEQREFVLKDMLGVSNPERVVDVVRRMTEESLTWGDLKKMFKENNLNVKFLS
jgi:hypothetical protein